MRTMRMNSLTMRESREMRKMTSNPIMITARELCDRKEDRSENMDSPIAKIWLRLYLRQRRPKEWKEETRSFQLMELQSIHSLGTKLSKFLPTQLRLSNWPFASILIVWKVSKGPEIILHTSDHIVRDLCSRFIRCSVLLYSWLVDKHFCSE